MWLLLSIVLVNNQPDFLVIAKTTTLAECLQLRKKQQFDSSLSCVYVKQSKE